MKIKDPKSRILDVSKKIFYENGYVKTTTREIALRAETSESGVFRHYRNKYEILMAVYDSCWQRVNMEIEQIVMSSPIDPREFIIQIIKTLWELYDREPETIAFIIMNTGNTDTLLLEKKEQAIVTPENEKYLLRIENLCEECCEKKLLNHEITTNALREGVLGISEGVLLGWYLYDKTGDLEYAHKKVTIEEAEKLLRIILFK